MVRQSRTENVVLMIWAVYVVVRAVEMVVSVL